MPKNVNCVIGSVPTKSCTSEHSLVLSYVLSPTYPSRFILDAFFAIKSFASTPTLFLFSVLPVQYVCVL